MNELEAVTKAIEVLDGPTKTARKLSESMGERVAPNTVGDWIRKYGKCPARYAWHLEHLTAEAGDRVTAAELNPVSFTRKSPPRKTTAA